MDVTAVFTCAEIISKKDVSLSLSATSVHLSVKGVVLIGGTLGGSIDPTSSTYTIDNDKLELFLSKSAGGGLTNWTELVIGDNYGTYEVDPEALATTAELLERFTSESQALGEGGVGQSFNTEQLEDCDVSMEDICKIRWLNCTSGKITHQASKTQRRFTTCQNGGEYAVIVEAKRHAFVYWQPLIVDSDLRNRRTGRRIPDLAKQYLITLSKRSDSGDDGVVSENIVGVHADTDFLFILTTADLFAFKVRHFREENNLVEMT
ncbi:unnamed protein product [Gongylonema pulchrum]|uniref:NudC domain-containing protein 1 n=1 Tax=Gongylonema pulchrum TaxID=637853 RepID=A0A183EAC2_9BILA|nr:unnamed protein product [Gongylonema pulchrum]